MNSAIALILLLTASHTLLSQNLIKVQPNSIKASSSYKKHGPPEHIMDGNVKTFWNPKKNRGIGEYIEFNFDKTHDIKLIRLFPGSGISSEMYFYNNRPKKISIKIDDQEAIQHVLKDAYGFQEISIDGKLSSLKITLLDKVVAKGSEHRSNFISEVEIFAVNPHIKQKYIEEIHLLTESSLSYTEAMNYKNKVDREFKDLLKEDKVKYRTLVQKQLKSGAINDMLLFKQKVDEMSTSISSFREINDIIRQINFDYREYKYVLKEVQSALLRARMKQSELVVIHYEAIANKIDNAQSDAELATVRSDYLQNAESTKEVQKLIELKNKRAKEISLEIARKEEESRQQKLAIKRAEEEKRRLAQQKEMEILLKMMNETTETREPNEAQMRFAIDYQVQLKNKEIDKMANVEATDGPSALIKLFGSLGSGTTSQISHFEKYGCVKANSKPGFICDYVIETKISGGLAESMYGGLLNQMGNAEIKTARFLKVKGIWKIVEYLSDN